MDVNFIQDVMWLLVQAVQAAVWSAGYELLCGEISRSASFFVVLAVLGEVMIYPLIAYCIGYKACDPLPIRWISNWFLFTVFLRRTMFNSSLEASFPMVEEYYEIVQRDAWFTQYCILPCILLFPLMMVYRYFIPSGGTREKIRKDIIPLVPDCISSPIASSYKVITRNITLHKVNMRVNSFLGSVWKNTCILISTVLSYSKYGFVMISFSRVLISLADPLIASLISLADSVNNFTVIGYYIGEKEVTIVGGKPAVFSIVLLLICCLPRIIGHTNQASGKQLRRRRGRRNRKKDSHMGVETPACSGSRYCILLGSMLWFAFATLYSAGLFLSGTKELLRFATSVPLEQYIHIAMRLCSTCVPFLACFVVGYRFDTVVPWIWQHTHSGQKQFASLLNGKFGSLLSMFLICVPMSMADSGGEIIDDMDLKEYCHAISMAVGMVAKAAVLIVEKTWKPRESKSNSFYNSETGETETYPKFTKHRDPNAFPIKDSPLIVNSSIKAIVHKYGKQFVDILLKHGYVLNPLSKVVDVSKFDWAKKIMTERYGMIYALYNKSGSLIKIGMTANAPERLEEYRKQYRNFDKNFILIRIVSFDIITAEIDQELSNLYKEFLLEVIQSSAPQNLKDFYQRILYEWHRGGIKRQQMMQLIETGLQIMYHLPCPSEGFMWDESKYNDHRSVAIKAAGEIIGLIAEQGARSATAFVFSICTWKTGVKEGVLSTGPSAAEYIVGKNRWTDIIGKALHPNATTQDEMFDDNFPTTTLDKAHKFFEDLISSYAQMSNRISHIIVDAQDYMYKSLETPQRILHRHGFRRVRTLLGGEIIVFQKDFTFIYLHGHLSIAGDSRDFITVEESQRRAIVIDVLKQVIRYATCQVDAAGTNFATSAILGSIIMEVSNCGLHGSLRFAAALFRDMITPKTINAIEKFGGENDVGLTPNDILYPSSYTARYVTRLPSSLMIDDLIRRFSYVTTASNGQLNKFFTTLKLDIEKSMYQSLNWSTIKWSKIITQLQSVSLVPKLEEYIRQWAADNDVVISDLGSRNRARESVDDIISSLTTGEFLAIPRGESWSSKTLETANFPQSISDKPFVIGGQPVSGGNITMITNVTDNTFKCNAEKVGVKLQVGFRYRKQDDLGEVLSTNKMTLVKVVSIPSKIESATDKASKTKSDQQKATHLERRKEKGLDCNEYTWKCLAPGCNAITQGMWMTNLTCGNSNCTSHEKVSNRLPKHPNTENSNWELVVTSVPKNAAFKTSNSKSSSKAKTVTKSKSSSRRKASREASTRKSVSNKISSQSSSSQPTRSSKRIKSQNTSSLNTAVTLSERVDSTQDERLQVQAERIQELRDERREQLRAEREYKSWIPKHDDNDGLWDYLVGDEALPHDMDLQQSRSEKVAYFSSLNVGDGAFIKRTSGRWEFTRIIAKIENTVFFQAGDGWKPADITIETTFDILRKKI